MAEGTTTVVNIKTGAPFDVYIGRAVSRARDPRCRERSVYANPWVVGRWSARRRSMALAEYEALWRRRLASTTRQWWLGRLLALQGQRLGCWCWPQPCHGDVLVRLIEEMKPAREPRCGGAPSETASLGDSNEG